jgi:large subunit ribosomal protein L10
MKPKTKKSGDFDRIRANFEQYSAVVLCNFEGLTVGQDQDLRRQVRASGGAYRVVQNRLAERAVKGTDSEGVLKGLKGMTSLAYAEENPLALVKVLVAYAKENPALQFRAGVVEGRTLDVEALNQLASLPGKDAIYAKLLYLINAPAQRLLSVIKAPGRELAIVLDQGVQESKFSA